MSACSTVGFGPGPRVQIPIEYPNGERVTLVAHNQKAPDFLLATNKLELNYAVRGTPTKEHEAAILATTLGCRKETIFVRPHEAVTIGSGAAVYGGLGFVGGGVASLAFPGASFSQYGKYVGAASGFSGAGNGIVTLGGKTYTFEDCSRGALELTSYKNDIRILMKSPY